ncbi:unnamed protein product, partial [Mesorhabditis spiculigera]
MGVDALMSIPGALSIVATLLSFAELFCICFVWAGGSVVFYIFIDGYGWHILFAPLVFLVFLFSVTLLLTIVTGREIINQYGKQAALICYGVCMFALIVAGVLISWYASKTHKDLGVGHILRPRYIAAAIFNWLNFVVYLALFVLTLIFQ